MQGPDPLDPNTFPSPLRDYHQTAQKLQDLKVAVWSESEGAVLTAETGNILKEAARALERLGIDVTDDKPPLADEIYDISQALYSPFFVNEWEDVLKEHGIEVPGPVDRDMIEGLADWAKPYSKEQVEAFQQRLPPLKTGLLTFLQKYDAIISPVTATPAPLHATTFDDIRRLVFVQLPAYVPAIPSGSVPCGFSKGDKNQNPLPIGIQVVGRRFREDTVLALMSALEKSLGGWVPPSF
jgi:Asp-tRNA(Asn)/Glu-tRNA(Gln) amidotransferase A subunit family amidase